MFTVNHCHRRLVRQDRSLEAALRPTKEQLPRNSFDIEGVLDRLDLPTG